MRPIVAVLALVSVSMVACSAFSPNYYQNATRNANYLAANGNLLSAADEYLSASEKVKVGSWEHSASLRHAAEFYAADGRQSLANDLLRKCIDTANDYRLQQNCRADQINYSGGRLPDKKKLIQMARQEYSDDQASEREAVQRAEAYRALMQSITTPAGGGTSSSGRTGSVPGSGSPAVVGDCRLDCSCNCKGPNCTRC